MSSSKRLLRQRPQLPGHVRYGLPLFGALTGVILKRAPFELAPGIEIRSTLIELIQSNTIAFALPEDASLPHPGPWQATRGGGTLECRVEISIREMPSLPVPTPARLLYLVAALIRLQVDSPVRLALIATDTFGPNMQSWPDTLEVHTSHGGAFADLRQSIEDADIADLQRRLPPFARLFQQHPLFHRSWVIFDTAQWCPGAEAAMVMVWSSMETFFQVGAVRRGKTAALVKAITKFLGPDGAFEVREILELCEERGGIIHAGRPPNPDRVGASFTLAKEIFRAAVDQERIPDAAT